MGLRLQLVPGEWGWSPPEQMPKITRVSVVRYSTQPDVVGVYNGPPPQVLLREMDFRGNPQAVSYIEDFQIRYVIGVTAPVEQDIPPDTVNDLGLEHRSDLREHPFERANQYHRALGHCGLHRRRRRGHGWKPSGRFHPEDVFDQREPAEHDGGNRIPDHHGAAVVVWNGRTAAQKSRGCGEFPSSHSACSSVRVSKLLFCNSLIGSRS